MGCSVRQTLTDLKVKMPSIVQWQQCSMQLNSFLIPTGPPCLKTFNLQTFQICPKKNNNSHHWLDLRFAAAKDVYSAFHFMLVNLSATVYVISYFGDT